MSETKPSDLQRIISEHLGRSQSPNGISPEQLANPKNPKIVYTPPLNARGSAQVK